MMFEEVALRKESVDRNLNMSLKILILPGSLSARRAWIEIRMALFPAPPTMVALRKESVDRNYGDLAQFREIVKSLSARRAWIEILLGKLCNHLC